jgi:hypothetical protein
MIRNRISIIGTMAVLMLIGIAAVPVSADHVIGHVTWNESSVALDTTATYSWYGNVEPVEYFIAIVDPDGTEVVNDTHYPNGGNGVGSYSVDIPGTWRVSIGNTTTTNQTYDDLTVGSTGWYDIGSTVRAFVGIIPDLIDLVVGVAPLVVLFGLIGFLVKFFPVLLDKFRL